jgi:hypothetical protein
MLAAAGNSTVGSSGTSSSSSRRRRCRQTGQVPRLQPQPHHHQLLQLVWQSSGRHRQWLLTSQLTQTMVREVRVVAARAMATHNAPSSSSSSNSSSSQCLVTCHHQYLQLANSQSRSSHKLILPQLPQSHQHQLLRSTAATWQLKQMVVM